MLTTILLLNIHSRKSKTERTKSILPRRIVARTLVNIVNVFTFVDSTKKIRQFSWHAAIDKLGSHCSAEKSGRSRLTSISKSPRAGLLNQIELA